MLGVQVLAFNGLASRHERLRNDLSTEHATGTVRRPEVGGDKRLEATHARDGRDGQRLADRHERVGHVRDALRSLRFRVGAEGRRAGREWAVLDGGVDDGSAGRSHE